MSKIFGAIFADKTLLILFCGLIASIILGIVLLVLFILMFRKYKKFMNGAKGESLEQAIMQHIDEIESLQKFSKATEKHLKKLDENMLIAYQKVAFKKYDAFAEMGGHLSFSLCMLDANENGFVMSSMHTNEGCYTYIKEIIKGEAFVLLSDEEKKVLIEAKTGEKK